jgi:V8-like Glu-specific endopeptidase
MGFAGVLILGLAAMLYASKSTSTSGKEDKTKESASEHGEPVSLRESTKSVVMIAMRRYGSVTPIGTGFVSDRGRFVVSNAHVVDTIKKMCLRGDRCEGLVIPNEQPDLQLKITAIQLHPNYGDATSDNPYEEDLALVDVETPEKLPRGLPLRSSEDITQDTLQGKDASIIGFPGLTMDPAVPNATISRGTVGRLHETTWIQHDVPMSPGNSGSPLLDEERFVVGVNYAGLGIRAVVTVDASGEPTVQRIQQGDGLNLAVSAAELERFIRKHR